MPVVWLSVSGDYMYRKQKRKMISKNDLFQIQNWLSGMSTVMKGQWVQYWKAYTSRGPSQYIFLLQQKWQISKTFSLFMIHILSHFEQVNLTYFTFAISALEYKKLLILEYFSCK